MVHYELYLANWAMMFVCLVFLLTLCFVHRQNCVWALGFFFDCCRRQFEFYEDEEINTPVNSNNRTIETVETV